MENLEIILSEHYGVNILNAPTDAILWAADQIQDIKVAKQEIKRVNILRMNYGIIPVYVPYGHRLF